MITVALTSKTLLRTRPAVTAGSEKLALSKNVVIAAPNESDEIYNKDKEIVASICKHVFNFKT